MTKRVLIADMLNLFFRSYIVDPSLSNRGIPIGGLKGVLKTLQKLVRDIRPDEIVLCWDGEGGSAKRKGIYEDYKEGRQPVRLNRFANVFSEDEELQNKVWQQRRLIEYLNLMPVIQFKFEGTEADDVIAFVSRHPFYESWQKVIVSSDKDFYQLCDDSTIIFRPVKKKDKEGKLLPNQLVSVPSLLEEHAIHPNNFALARALAGDKSDNLEGVGGIGLKTAAKRFPMLYEEKSYTAADIIKHSKLTLEKNKKTIKAYQNVIENSDILERNYKMMQLYIPSLSYKSKVYIKTVLNKFEFFVNKTEITKMMITDGFVDLNLMTLFTKFNKIIIDQNFRKE